MTRELQLSFQQGREYEQEEALLLLTYLLEVTDPEQLHSLLRAWHRQIIDQLVANGYHVKLEETYVVTRA